MLSQTAIFSKLVKDFMRSSPLALKTDTPCPDVIAKMGEADKSCAIITDDRNRPLGIITEQDIVRRVAFKASRQTVAEEVMSRPVQTIGSGEYLYQAIGRMRKSGLRHMPVIDEDGRLVGILDLHDTLAVAANRLTGQIDRFTHEGTIEGLQRIKEAQVEVAGELFADNLPAPDIQALLTQINKGIYRRVIDISLRDMADEGWGEPPVDFCVIVLGSGGRGENYLFPDQDNGFIIEDYPDAEHPRIDAFFIELAERMTGSLDEVGITLCKGYCMASNPLWRKTLCQWIDQIKIWGRKQHFVAIRLADVFFDFQPVWGNYELAGKLRSEVTKMARNNHLFLRQMYQEEADHNVALGFFGGFITEQEKEEYKGYLSLKHTGTLPLIGTVRLLALREGVVETSTLMRIDALYRMGVLSANDREGLCNSFEIITDILLRQQIRDFTADRKVSYYVDPKGLSRHTRAKLTEALKTIDEMRQRVRTEFTGDIF